MNKFMKIADDMARENLVTNYGGPFGCAIVKDNEVIAKSSNLVLKNIDPTAHAEIETIRLAAKNLGTHDLSGCELYTSCMPCPMCLSAIIWANIKTVYYGNTKVDADKIGFRDDYIYEFIKSDMKNIDILSLTELDRDKTIMTFNDFHNKKDKEIY